MADRLTYEESDLLMRFAAEHRVDLVAEAVRLVERSAPWRWSRRGLRSELERRFPAERRHVRRAVREAIDVRGLLVVEHRPEKRGRKMRVGLARTYGPAEPPGTEAGREGQE